LLGDCISGPHACPNLIISTAATIIALSTAVAANQWHTERRRDSFRRQQWIRARGRNEAVFVQVRLGGVDANALLGERKNEENTMEENMIQRRKKYKYTNV
jgi:hypothetical protein